MTAWPNQSLKPRPVGRFVSRQVGTDIPVPLWLSLLTEKLLHRLRILRTT
jgi:hypothetical protein